MPYAMFKGSGIGELLDPEKGNLNPATYLLVKQDQLPVALLPAPLPAQSSSPPIWNDEQPPEGDSGGGLSAGAIAGKGRICKCCCTCAAVCLRRAKVHSVS